MLSLPAVFRAREAFPGCRWFFWGPTDRLTLLPGFEPAPPEVERLGHTLWGSEPAEPLLEVLRRCRAVLAFGGWQAPTTIPFVGDHTLTVSSFPRAEPCWVPVCQARQLDALRVPRVRRPWIREWRRQVLPPREPDRIVLHPGSGDPKKNVPVEIWAEVLGELKRETGWPVGLVVGPAELERGGWEKLRAAVDSVHECLTIGDLLAVFSHARIFLGNDSGATHLAGLLGIPTVAVFGPSDPRLWRPLGPLVRVVTAGWSCAPCSSGRPIACADPACLDSVAAEAVLPAAVELLERGGNP